MSKNEIKKGMKVHDILADYFTKDLKVKASLKEEEEIEDDIDDQSEGKRHRHHKKHKKNKKKKKRSHNDSEPDDEELNLLEQDVKKRKLEYELLKEQEKERKKSRRKSQEEAEKEKKLTSDLKKDYSEHKTHCKKHNSEKSTTSKRKSVDDDGSQAKKKLTSSILITKNKQYGKEKDDKDSMSESRSKEKRSSHHRHEKDSLSKSNTRFKEESHLKKIESNHKYKVVKSPDQRSNHSLKEISIEKEPNKTLESKRVEKDKITMEESKALTAEEPKPLTAEEPKPLTAEEPKPLTAEEPKPLTAEEPKPEARTEEPKPETRTTEESKPGMAEEPLKSTEELNLELEKEAGDMKIGSSSTDEVSEKQKEPTDAKIEEVAQEKKNCLPEPVRSKEPEKDSNEVFEKKDNSSKNKKISIKSLKNLDLLLSKDESNDKSEVDDKVVDLLLEEGEVIDSDVDGIDDNEDGEDEGSDFFKGEEEGLSKEEKKKKKKHKHKKSKKKKKSKDAKSPEAKSSSRRLSDNSSHHHHHSNYHPEADDRFFEENRHHGYKRNSRDRSHSPGTSKRYASRGSHRGRITRERSIALDLREKIDKKRLLEIARKNVLSMIEKGTLPSGIATNVLAQQQLVTLRAGGKSVAELTEFCKGLVNGKDYLSSESSDEEGKRRALSEEEGDTPFINHPFKLREPLPHIRMNIPNAVQIPVRTADTAKLRQIFPVSSGNQHRIKELEWVPVEKTETTTATTTVSKKAAKEPKAIMPAPPPVAAPIPLPPPPAALLFPQPSQLAIGPAPPLTMGASGSLIPMTGPLVEQEEPPPPGIGPTQIAMPPPPLPPPPPPPLPAPEPEPEPEQLQQQPPPSYFQGVDISTIVANRLHAVRRLQENPLDMQALNQMFQAQQQMKDWAHSKLQPGQFGAAPNTRLLTPSELSGPSPVWAKKNQLTNAAPVSDGVGMNLLRKMGWNPGEGLGKNKEGALTPLMLDIKMDKKGLVSTTEGNKPPPKVNLPNRVRQDLSGKHPVSALMELCSKRKWGAPEYTLLDEGGPAHRKNFLFKVRVQTTDYQPSVSSPNKKQAKALAAQVCLQGLGLLPRTI